MTTPEDDAPGRPLELREVLARSSAAIKALATPVPGAVSNAMVERAADDGWQAEAEAQARALAERAGIDMLDDHDQFLVDLETTLIEFAEWANKRLLAEAAALEAVASPKQEAVKAEPVDIAAAWKGRAVLGVGAALAHPQEQALREADGGYVVTIYADGDHENTPAEAIHHGLEHARKAGFITAWSDAALAGEPGK